MKTEGMFGSAVTLSGCYENRRNVWVDREKKDKKGKEKNIKDSVSLYDLGLL